MKLSLEIGLNNVIFERDAKKIGDEVMNFEENQTSHGQLIEYIKCLGRGRPAQKFVFCPQEGNMKAHKLAKVGLGLVRRLSRLYTHLYSY